MEMSKKLVLLPLVCGLFLTAQSARAQVGGGTWTEIFPTFSVQQRGCGVANNLTFSLTCSDTTNDNRAERRYATYGGSITRQFEGSFKITSLSGTRISLKQTFKDDPGAGPDFMMAVEHDGRLYAVHGGDTIAASGTATVGTTVRVNTIQRVGTDHRCYINGSLKFTVASASGNYYDKFGFYRTSSGAGPGSVTWSGIHFWQAGGNPTATPTPRATPTPAPTATPSPTPTPRATPTNDVEVTPNSSGVTASTNDGNIPANAVDNNLTTRWSANGDGQWIKLDLAATMTVTRVRVAVYNGNSRQNRFDIQVSTDNTSWANVLTNVSSSGTTTQEENYDFGDTPARWVRYVGHGNSVNAFNSVTEISVFALPSAITPTPTPVASTPTPTPTGTPTTPPSYVEVTPSGAAVTASTNDGNVPANAVDNNLATRWTGNGDGAWLQLDLGTTRTVGHVKVAAYNGNTRRNLFDIQVSSGSGVWTTVWTGGTSGTTTAEETFDFADVSARYVRYLGHMNTVNTFNSVTEISVFALP
jgi:hypothetical protein